MTEEASGRRRRARIRRAAVRGWGMALLALCTALDGVAQDAQGRGGSEIRLLQEAAALEAAGDYAGAERVVRAVLEDRPTSLSAILSLERLLRVQGRLEELIPALQRMLTADQTSTVGHQMLVRTYSALNRLEDMERAAERWMRAMPRLETPYREVARVWQARRQYGRAIQVLERGRERVGRPDALALELGDVYVEEGDLERAVDEWSRAIGPEGRGYTLVKRRLMALPDGGAQLIPGLIESLERPPSSVGRLRAATDLAVDAGLEPKAESLAKQVAAQIVGAERHIFLVEIGRRAEGARLPRLAYWAYSELLEMEAPEEQLLTVRSRLASLALAVGDTARARESYQILEKAFAAGSPERREAAAFRIELAAREEGGERALEAFESFRREFPDAPELDRLGAAVGNRLLAEGKLDEAERLLRSVTGPRSSMARGRLALRKGDLQGARSAFLTAAQALSGAEATETIALATMLGRLSSAAGEVLGRASTELANGRAHEAVAVLVGGTQGLSAGERSVLLDHAASLADRAGLAEEAERIRRTIITDYAQFPEAPAALLALARALAGREDRVAEARELLERLILDHPRSALVPQARRELDRLQGRVPSS